MSPVVHPMLPRASRFGLGMVAIGLLINIALVVLLLGDAVRPGQISLSAIALMATLGGALLVGGLAMAEPGAKRH